MSSPFSSVGIVGLGLMGGSLARALKDAPDPPRVVGLTLAVEDLSAAIEGGAVDEGHSESSGFFGNLDLVVYCTPPTTTIHLLREHRGFLEPTTVVTDVVSLKGPILDEARALGLAERFVGSHPLAGGEGSGFHSGRPGLYHGAPVWIVPGDAPEELLSSVETFWAWIGARPERIGAHEHDVLMTWVSHLPQAVSSALAAALRSEGIERAQLGPAGRDLTRLAGSSPDLWIDLFRQAPDSLLKALGTAEAALGNLRRDLEEGQSEGIRDLMDANRRWYEDQT